MESSVIDKLQDEVIMTLVSISTELGKLTKNLTAEGLKQAKLQLNGCLETINQLKRIRDEITNNDSKMVLGMNIRDLEHQYDEVNNTYVELGMAVADEAIPAPVARKGVYKLDDHTTSVPDARRFLGLGLGWSPNVPEQITLIPRPKFRCVALVEPPDLKIEQVQVLLDTGGGIVLLDEEWTYRLISHGRGVYEVEFVPGQEPDLVLYMVERWLRKTRKQCKTPDGIYIVTYRVLNEGESLESLLDNMTATNSEPQIQSPAVENFVIVESLPPNTTQSDIATIFDMFVAKRVEIVNSTPRTNARVYLKSQEQVQSALYYLDNQPYGDSSIRVKLPGNHPEAHVIDTLPPKLDADQGHYRNAPYTVEPPPMYRPKKEAEQKDYDNFTRAPPAADNHVEQEPEVEILGACVATPEQYERIVSKMKHNKIIEHIFVKYHDHIRYIAFKVKGEEQLTRVSRITKEVCGSEVNDECLLSSVSLIVLESSCSDITCNRIDLQNALQAKFTDDSMDIQFALKDGLSSRVWELVITSQDICTLLDDYNRLLGFYSDENGLQVKCKCGCGCKTVADIKFKVADKVKPFMIYGQFGDKLDAIDAMLRKLNQPKIVWTQRDPITAELKHSDYRLLCYAQGDPDVAWKPLILDIDGIPLNFVCVESTHFLPTLELVYTKPLCQAFMRIERLEEACKTLTQVLSTDRLIRDHINVAVFLVPSYQIVVECKNDSHFSTLIRLLHDTNVNFGGFSIRIKEAVTMREAIDSVDNIVSNVEISDANVSALDVLPSLNCLLKNQIPTFDGIDSSDEAKKKKFRVFTMIHQFGRIAEDKYTDNRGNTHKLNVSCLKNTIYSARSLLAKSYDSRFRNVHISVVENDSLVCAADVVSSYSSDTNVAVLNMANEEKPGGGYLTGARAQEEEIMRRTTLAAALDPNSLRGYCDRMNKSMPNIDKVQYPWSGRNTDVVITEGVMVFKSTADTQYAYLDNPFAVNIISTAAPNIRNLTFNDEHVELLKERIHALFRAAIEKGVRVLVLSALGCGAFCNPPEQVAQIFYSAIACYGGFFDRIVFGILGENFKVFYKILKPLIDNSGDIIYRDGPNVTAPAVCTGCYTENCDKLHMPLCEGDSCDLSLAHKVSFRHACTNTSCRCTDRQHLCMFQHSPRCKFWSLCKNFTEEHCRQFSHPPTCDKGYECTHKDEPDHSANFRHKVQDQCYAGTLCTLFNCEKHGSKLLHKPVASNPRVPLFPETTGGISLVCTDGMQCKYFIDSIVHCDTSDPVMQHLDKYFHLYRQPCKDRAGCKYQNNEEHLLNYSHPAVPDFRPQCPDMNCCTQRNVTEHCQKYSHAVKHVPLCLRPSAPIVSSRNVDFYKNMKSLDGALSVHITDHSLDAALRFIESARPVHRCPTHVLQSILAHGYLMSVKQMLKLNDVDDVASQAMLNPVLDSEPDLPKRAILADYLQKMTKRKFKDLAAKNDESMVQDLRKSFGDTYTKWIKDLDTTAELIAKSSQELYEKVVNPKEGEVKYGINYETDKVIGTNDTIFTILGPNSFTHYGPVYIVLSRECMYHPDYFHHVSAATFYYSQDSMKVAHRGHYMLNGPKEQPSRIDQYYNSIQNPAVGGSNEVLARDFGGIICDFRGKSDLDFERDIVFSVVNSHQSEPKGMDAHFLVEGHLPSRLPMSFIKAIVMDNDAYAAITDPEAKKRLDALRRSNIDVCIESDWKKAAERAALLSLEPPYYERKLCGFTFSFSVDEYTIPMSLTSGDSSIYFQIELMGPYLLIGLTHQVHSDEIPPLVIVISSSTAGVILNNRRSIKELCKMDDDSVQRLVQYKSVMSWPTVEATSFRTYLVGLTEGRSRLIIMRKNAPVASDNLRVDVGALGHALIGVQMGTRSNAHNVSVKNMRLSSKFEVSEFEKKNMSEDLRYTGPQVPPELFSAEKQRILGVEEPEKVEPKGFFQKVTSGFRDFFKSDVKGKGKAVDEDLDQPVTKTPKPPPLKINIGDIDLMLDTSAMFVMDCTGSMGQYINACADSIISMAKTIEDSAIKQAVNKGMGRNVKASFGFVGYRDLGDEGHPTVFQFSNVERLAKNIKSMKAVGGDDIPEDIVTGLDAAIDVAWPRGNRMLFVVADAANHGPESYGSRSGDNHFATDEKGVAWSERWLKIVNNVKKNRMTLILLEVKPGVLQRTYDYLSKLLKDQVKIASITDALALAATVTKLANECYADHLKSLNK